MKSYVLLGQEASRLVKNPVGMLSEHVLALIKQFCISKLSLGQLSFFKFLFRTDYVDNTMSKFLISTFSRQARNSVAIARHSKILVGFNTLNIMKKIFRYTLRQTHDSEIETLSDL